jgi:hypothetical protein
MSEREAKQKRRRRAKLIRDVLGLALEAYNDARADKLVTDALALSDTQFAQLSLRLAKHLAQIPTRDKPLIRGGQ